MIKLYFGKSSAGKDTFMKKAVVAGAIPIISATTRPPREGEIEGIDYYYKSDEKFKEMIENNELIEYRKYTTTVGGHEAIWYYGTPVINGDIKNDTYVGVVDIDGVKSFLKHYNSEDIELIYVEVSDDNVRETRARFRGSFDEIEWARRKVDDDEKFSTENLKELANLYGKPITKILNNEKLTFSTIEPDK